MLRTIKIIGKFFKDIKIGRFYDKNTQNFPYLGQKKKKNGMNKQIV